MTESGFCCGGTVHWWAGLQAGFECMVGNDSYWSGRKNGWMNLHVSLRPSVLHHFALLPGYHCSVWRKPGLDPWSGRSQPVWRGWVWSAAEICLAHYSTESLHCYPPRNRQKRKCVLRGRAFKYINTIIKQHVCKSLLWIPLQFWARYTYRRWLVINLLASCLLAKTGLTYKSSFNHNPNLNHFWVSCLWLWWVS